MTTGKGMTFGPEDKSAAEILRDPTSSFSDLEAVARYVQLLEGLLPKAIGHRRNRFDLERDVSREEATIVRELCRAADLAAGDGDE